MVMIDKKEQCSDFPIQKHLPSSDLQGTLPDHLLPYTPTLHHHYPLLDIIVWFTPTVPYLNNKIPSNKLWPRSPRDIKTGDSKIQSVGSASFARTPIPQAVRLAWCPCLSE